MGVNSRSAPVGDPASLCSHRFLAPLHQTVDHSYSQPVTADDGSVSFGDFLLSCPSSILLLLLLLTHLSSSALIALMSVGCVPSCYLPVPNATFSVVVISK